MPMRFAALSVPLLVVAVVAGCEPAATPTGTPAGSPGTPVAVTLREFAIEPSPSNVAAGPVTFRITNSGTIEHEFVILGPTGLPVDQLPSDDGGQTVDEEEVGVVGEQEAIGAGTSATLNATLAAGNYVLICNIETHYTSGMRVAFTVH